MAFDSTGVWSTFFATTLGESERLSVVNLAVGDKEAGRTEVVLCFPASVAASLTAVDFPNVAALFAALSQPFSEPTIAARGESTMSSDRPSGKSVAEANQRPIPDNSVTVHSAEASATRPDGFAVVEGDDNFCFYKVIFDYRKLSFKERHFSSPARSLCLAFTFEHEAVVHPGLRASTTTSGNPNYYTAVSDDFDGEPNDGSPHGFGMPEFSQTSLLQSALPMGDQRLPPDVKHLFRVRATKPSAVPLLCRRRVG